jgi:hypothetical protein
LNLFRPTGNLIWLQLVLQFKDSSDLPKAKKKTSNP